MEEDFGAMVFAVIVMSLIGFGIAVATFTGHHLDDDTWDLIESLAEAGDD